METRTVIGADGLQLNCIDYGGAGRPPVLLIHGGAAHAHWWDFVGPALTANHHVLALDQRGHGDSPWTAEWAYGSRHYVADLEAIIASWGLGEPVLVGHSMGGHNVLVHAGTRSHTLRGLAVIDSTPIYPKGAVEMLRGTADRPARRFDSLAEACANFRTVPNKTVARREVFSHVAAHSFRQGADGKWDYKGDRRTMVRDPINAARTLDQIACPALFVKAENSALPPGGAEKTVAAMPHGRLVVVPASHHHVLLDNPEGLAAVLARFLGDLV